MIDFKNLRFLTSNRLIMMPNSKSTKCYKIISIDLLKQAEYIQLGLS